MRENLLGEIKQNLEETDDKDISPVTGILSLCPTTWTVRGQCFQRIIDNYDALLMEWDYCLATSLPSEVKARILRCQAQMTKFNFYFGLHLSQRLFVHTDNLSKALQNTKMSASSGQKIAEMTKQTILSMRSDEGFDGIYANVLKQKEKHEEINDPELPRRKRMPQQHEVGSGDRTIISSNTQRSI